MLRNKALKEGLGLITRKTRYELDIEVRCALALARVPLRLRLCGALAL